jgi:hypothetical protein
MLKGKKRKAPASWPLDFYRCWAKASVFGLYLLFLFGVPAGIAKEQ